MKSYFFIQPKRIVIVRMIDNKPVYQEFKARINLPPDVILEINDEQLEIFMSEEFKKEWKIRIKHALRNFLLLLKDLFIAIFSNILF